MWPCGVEGGGLPGLAGHVPAAASAAPALHSDPILLTGVFHELVGVSVLLLAMGMVMAVAVVVSVVVRVCVRRRTSESRSRNELGCRGHGCACRVCRRGGEREDREIGQDKFSSVRFLRRPAEAAGIRLLVSKGGVALAA